MPMLWNGNIPKTSCWNFTSIIFIFPMDVMVSRLPVRNISAAVCLTWICRKRHFLCAIPNNPSIYDPLTHADKTIERRNLILQNMLDDGIINEQQYTDAVNEKIHAESVQPVLHSYMGTYVYL